MTLAPGRRAVLALPALTLPALTLPALLTGREARAEAEWPSRPVRLLIPFPPGQATDTMLRLLADELSRRWPQRVVVENRAGGAGVVGTDAGARAAPDGYTLLASTSGTHGINPSVIPNLPYDAEADFAYITTVFTVPLVIVAHPSFAPRTVAELVAAARQAPGAINYGSGGPGTSQHMAAEMFAHQAGVRLTHVPYRGSGPAVADLLAGNIPMMFDSVASALPHVQAGRIRALGVTSAARAPQLPEVPSIGETLSGYVAIGWGGLCAPAGTPEPILRRVNAEVTSLLRDPAFAARMQQMGGTPAPQEMAEAGAFVRAEIAKWRAVARTANVRLGG
ncbi:Bug family tripartite tricarboxylate transporter substrate binding protein [Teichococcus aestuarii]|uniref:Transporter n=1 Tax=Teichococcus aestuarii TaxID=568898 RepID=A0A2U1V8Q6_9PROT|nr:tripartite tricarboxylate transporter substrate binding protein [Pseudoroseomonas aestuarii]PWC30283.1 transporter [Pseudoroseomonas aestuarii]